MEGRPKPSPISTTAETHEATQVSMPVREVRRSGVTLLSLNTDLPIFPGGGGVEFLTMTRLAALCGDVGLVSFAHTRRDLNGAQALADAGIRLYLWESPWLDGAPDVPQRTVLRTVHGWVRRLVEAMRAWRGRPFDTRIMDAAFSNMAPQILRALTDRSWHVVSVVQSSAAGMIDQVPRPLVSVLVMHDIRARLYDRQAAVAASRIERRRLLEEGRRYFEFERTYCRKFDLVTTVSEEDARWVRAHYQPTRVVHVPLPVDADHFAPQPSSLERDARIVFTGMLNHPPNVDAACYFATEVLPLIQARHPAAQFHVAGRNPVGRVLELRNRPGVQVFGDVPDMRTHLAEASIVVVPLRFGSGARQKILEAWSMEKCVVATRIGAEGLEYEDGVNIVIADDTRALAESVTSAIQDPAVRQGLRSAGRSVARRHHDPGGVARGYLEALEQIVAEKAAADVPMKVLLDMRWMIPGLAGGIENLARAFLQELRAIDGRNEYTALVPARSRHDLEGVPSANVHMVSLDSVSALFRRARAGVRQRVWQALRLPNLRTPEVETLRWFRDMDVEIAYSFPGYIHPELYGLRHVLVVPDIQHEFVPEFFSREALAERRRLYTESAHRADHICAISEFTRQTLIEKLSIPARKVTTVLLAADAMFSPAPVNPSAAADDDRVLAKNGLERGAYLFLPAHTWQHKNHRTAIDALRILRDRHSTSPVLACTGGPREAQPAIDAQIAAAGLSAQVRFLGYRPRRELLSLYRGAACLIFPSLFEGFGMPVLEAMASGCPVVCSNTSSLPEIAGDAAILVNPLDPEAIAAALHRVLTELELRADLTARGLHRARMFSWRRHTLETISVLRGVHDQIRRR